MQVAVLGMGRMGQAVAARLLGESHAVTIWNRSPGKAGELADAGATEAASIAAAVKSADVVMSCLASDQAVRDVAVGGGGIAESIDGALYAECSTVGPPLSAELENHFERFVAMPIMGSPDAVRAGKATYLAGGSDESVGLAVPLLRSLSSTHHLYPAAALASAAKLASNLILLDSIAAVAESVAVARAGGLTDEQIQQLLADNPLLGPGVKNRLDAVITGEGDAWWTVDLGIKDAGLALEIAARGNVQLPVTLAATERYRATADRGMGDHDIADVASLYRPTDTV
jgi:3-hydroxyisobutyrate dehydrogenase-like beta-hydroxyacid dehydrogenase